MFNFITRKLLEKQMEGVPPEVKEKLFSAVEKNPDLFMSVATRMKELKDSGISEQDAARKAIEEKESELRNAVS